MVISALMSYRVFYYAKITIVRNYQTARLIQDENR
jgi:hypothetical protein